ncbi:fragment of putative ABC transporter, periplasmic binding protein (part 1) [Bradyrhizobium sp. STM 3843]|nr:fragment of putative ABC transporter, periplasmic binding protein (part 1) [Bradyrhizobium sp. STM 3843]
MRDVPVRESVKTSFTATRVLGALLGAAALFVAMPAKAETTLTIATVNNGDMIRMQGLTGEFTKANPDISVKWVTLEENVLRQRVTTDIATKGGQFDILTIGTYEVPIWAKKNWLVPLDKLPADYDTGDLLPKIKDAVSVDGKLYAAPFYGESSMVMYRTDLFEKAGLKMPENPTWDFVIDAAKKLTDKQAGVFGICLRGKAGWGENMAFLTAMSNSYGARWFDEKWEPQFNTPEWKKTLSTYVDLMKEAGPPGASSNGFNENLALFNAGKCAMWIDATVAASFVTNRGLQGRRQGRLRHGAEYGPRQERQLALGLESGDSRRLQEGRCGREVHRLGDQQGLHQARRREGRLGQCAAGHPHLAVPESGLSEGRSVRQADAGLDRCGGPEPSDRQAGALCRRAICRDP